MAAGCVMLPGARLFLLVGAAADRRWRAPLRAAAQAAGLEVLETPAPEFFDIEQPVVVLSDDGNWSAHIDAGRAHVFWGGDLPGFPSGEASFHDRHELYKASRNLVIGVHMVEHGAPLCDAASTSVSLDGLGEVVAEKGVFPETASPSPLDLYSVTPPPVGARAEWPPHLFSYQPEAFFDASARVDLTGRSRIVIHGPYLFLPSGCWQATLRFSVEPGAKHIPLTIRWGHESNYDSHDVLIERGGVYELVLEREWAGPGAAQIVVSLNRPIFEGIFEIESCRVEKIGLLSAKQPVPVEVASDA